MLGVPPPSPVSLQDERGTEAEWRWYCTEELHRGEMICLSPTHPRTPTGPWKSLKFAEEYDKIKMIIPPPPSLNLKIEMELLELFIMPFIFKHFYYLCGTSVLLSLRAVAEENTERVLNLVRSQQRKFLRDCRGEEQQPSDDYDCMAKKIHDGWRLTGRRTGQESHDTDTIRSYLKWVTEEAEPVIFLKGPALKSIMAAGKPYR